MIMYEYICDACNSSFEQLLDSSDDRDVVTEAPCEFCGAFDVRRVVGCGGFEVSEGSCGNSKNGYSSFHGDAENFKAGRKVYK